MFVYPLTTNLRYWGLRIIQTGQNNKEVKNNNYIVIVK